MNASIVDLRYRTRKILDALARRERVNLLYRGKLTGRIVPVKPSASFDAARHPFFGMHAGERKPVREVMRELRGGRYRAL